MTGGLLINRLAYTGAALSVVLLALCFSRGVYPTPDAYANYGLALSLAEEGEYSNYDWEGSPSHVKYPPLYPAALAGLHELSPGGVLLLNGLGPVLLCAGAFAIVRKLRVLGFASPGLLLAGAIVVGNRYLQNYAWGTMSDVPFLGALGLSILLFPFERRIRSGWWIPLGLGIGALSLGVRLTGVVTLLALILCLLAQRRWLPALLFSLAAGAVYFVWQQYVAASVGSTTDSYTTAVRSGPASDLLRYGFHRLEFILSGIGVLAVPHLDRVISWPPAFTILGIAMFSGAMAHLALRRPTGAVFFAAFLLGNVGLICITNFFEHQRYLFPLYMVVVFLLVDALLSWAPLRRWGRVVVAAALVWCLATSAFGAFRSVRREVDAWRESPISRVRVEQSGASQNDRATILALMSLRDAWSGEEVALVHCPSLRTRSYASLLLPGKVGWRPCRDAQETEEYLSKQLQGGRVFVLTGHARSPARAFSELVSAGRLKAGRNQGQAVFDVYEFR